MDKVEQIIMFGQWYALLSSNQSVKPDKIMKVLYLSSPLFLSLAHSRNNPHPPLGHGWKAGNPGGSGYRLENSSSGVILIDV